MNYKYLLVFLIVITHKASVLGMLSLPSQWCAQIGAQAINEISYETAIKFNPQMVAAGGVGVCAGFMTYNIGIGITSYIVSRNIQPVHEAICNWAFFSSLGAGAVQIYTLPAIVAATHSMGMKPTEMFWGTFGSHMKLSLFIGTLGAVSWQSKMNNNSQLIVSAFKYAATALYKTYTPF